MLLSSYGLISIDGSVTKLDPGLDFASYQLAMSRYGTTLALQSRVETQRSATPPEPSPATTEPATPLPLPLATDKPKQS
jgi:hypothetical protein